MAYKIAFTLALVTVSLLVQLAESRAAAERKQVTLKLRQKAARRHSGNNTHANGLVMHDVASTPLFGHANGLTYETRISLGEPLQTLKVLVSTTAPAGLWVPQRGCANKGENSRFCPNQGTYDPAASKKTKKVRKGFKRDTAQTGIYRKDVMAFGDAKCPKLTLKSPVVFGAATQTVGGDQGVLDLGFPGQASDPILTNVFEQLVKDGQLDAPMFSTHHKGCAKEGGCKKAGSLTLGGVDESVCAEVQDWAPVPDGEKSWAVKMSFQVEGYRLRKEFTAHIDSAHPYVHMPADQLNAVARQLSARMDNGGHTMSCDKKWALKLQINGHSYEIPHELLTKKVEDGSKCELLIKKDTKWLLGAPLARAYCIAYHWEKKAVGLATVKRDLEPLI